MSFGYKDHIYFSKVNGIFLIDEDFQVGSDMSLNFYSVKNRDPFQRVDYERLLPLLVNKYDLSIDRIHLPSLEIGPVLANLEIKQNLLQLKSFDFEAM